LEVAANGFARVRGGYGGTVSRAEISIDVPPERVWAVLADPDSYSRWVVGSKNVRDADAGFPAPGTRFHHTVGIGPISIDDHTKVLAADPPRRLELLARARPLANAHVTIEVRPASAGSTVSMSESAGDLLSKLLINPLTGPLISVRNAESLQRLRQLSEAGKHR
jgi:uncharacterized protein YndB with AHSA1/START domain